MHPRASHHQNEQRIFPSPYGSLLQGAGLDPRASGVPPQAIQAQQYYKNFVGAQEAIDLAQQQQAQGQQLQQLSAQQQQQQQYAFAQYNANFAQAQPASATLPPRQSSLLAQTSSPRANDAIKFAQRERLSHQVQQQQPQPGAGVGQPIAPLPQHFASVQSAQNDPGAQPQQQQQYAFAQVQGTTQRVSQYQDDFKANTRRIDAQQQQQQQQNEPPYRKTMTSANTSAPPNSAQLRAMQASTPVMIAAATSNQQQQQQQAVPLVAPQPQQQQLSSDSRIKTYQFASQRNSEPALVVQAGPPGSALAANQYPRQAATVGVVAQPQALQPQVTAQPAGGLPAGSAPVQDGAPAAATNKQQTLLSTPLKYSSGGSTNATAGGGAAAVNATKSPQQFLSPQGKAVPAAAKYAQQAAQQYVPVEEYRRVRDLNETLTQRLQALEGKVSRYQDGYVEDLQAKTKMLIDQNDRLYAENQRLAALLQQQQQGGTFVRVEDERKIAELQDECARLQRVHAEVREDMLAWKLRAEELEASLIEKSLQGRYAQQQFPGAESQQVLQQELIQENERLKQILTQRIDEIEDLNRNQQQINDALRAENDRLTEDVAQLRSDIQYYQSAHKMHQGEIEQWRRKYDDLEAKIATAAASAATNDDDPYAHEYRERVKDLEGKIKILIEENDKLNLVLNENLKGQSNMADLEDRISNLLNDNNQLEENIKAWKTKCERLQHQIKQISHTQQPGGVRASEGTGANAPGEAFYESDDAIGGAYKNSDDVPPVKASRKESQDKR